MKILFIPQIPLNTGERIKYIFEDDVIKIEFENGEKDIFDFSSFGEGILKKGSVETDLTENPLQQAFRENGILHVVLMNYIGLDATEERFPDWIDHTEYVPPVKEGSNGGDAVEDEATD